MTSLTNEVDDSPLADVVATADFPAGRAGEVGVNDALTIGCCESMGDVVDLRS